MGCSGSVASADSATSCYLVEVDAGDRVYRLAADLGSGAIGALQRQADPTGLDAVLLTHGHPDHMADAYGLSVYLRYGPGSRETPLPLVGPSGIGARVVDVGGGDDSALSPFAVHEVDPGDEGTFGPLTVTTARANHPVPALAYRFTGPSVCDGKTATLVYTGDTDVSDDVAALAQGADVLLAEAGWGTGTGTPGYHLTARQAGELAQRAGVGRLVLTHLAPWADRDGSLDAAADAFDGDIQLAVPGAVVEL